MNRFADQKTQVGMAGPYNAETVRRHGQTSPRRGRPRNTWRRKVLEEAKGVTQTWAEIKSDAKKRVRWRIPQRNDGILLLSQEQLVSPDCLFSTNSQAVSWPPQHNIQN
jgi:hypothetical protein